MTAVRVGGPGALPPCGSLAAGGEVSVEPGLELGLELGPVEPKRHDGVVQIDALRLPESFFQTSIEFRPTLQARHDDAANKCREHRAQLFNRLLTGIAEDEAS